MSRKLDDLNPTFRPKAAELIAQSAEAGIPLMIVYTLRTPEEQAIKLAEGTSKTQHSKHLPQPPDGKSKAIDLAPYEVYQLHGADKLNWDAGKPEAVKEPWATMGRIGESLGLRWGGRWHDPFDPGHFELVGD